MKGVYIPEPAFEAFLEQAAKETQDILDLRQYRVVFKFVQHISAYSHIPADKGYTFQVENDEVYMEAAVHASLLAQEKFLLGELRGLREDLLHELSHILTWPITDAIGKRKSKQETINLDENLTQRVAMIASKLLR